MNIIEMKLADIIPYENNPRRNEDAVQYVANSIKEFGFKVPIVIDKENVIVAGHTRALAAESLGMETVPVIVADDLTDEQIKAFRLADNKTAEMAGWDFEALELELGEIEEIDMADFGFNTFLGEFEDDFFDSTLEESKEDTGEITGKFFCANEDQFEDLKAFMEEKNIRYKA